MDEPLWCCSKFRNPLGGWITGFLFPTKELSFFGNIWASTAQCCDVTASNGPVTKSNPQAGRSKLCWRLNVVLLFQQQELNNDSCCLLHKTLYSTKSSLSISVTVVAIVLCDDYTHQALSLIIVHSKQGTFFSLCMMMKWKSATKQCLNSFVKWSVLYSLFTYFLFQTGGEQRCVR